MVDLPRIMPSAEEAGMLARPGQGTFNQVIRQRHPNGNTVASRLHMAERRSKIGKFIPRFHPVQIAATSGDRRRPAGQRDMRGEQMIVFPVRWASTLSIVSAM